MKLKDKKTLNEILTMDYEFIGLAKGGEYAVFAKDSELIYMAKHNTNQFVCEKRYVEKKEVRG